MMPFAICSIRGCLMDLFHLAMQTGPFGGMHKRMFNVSCLYAVHECGCICAYLIVSSISRSELQKREGGHKERDCEERYCGQTEQFNNFSSSTSFWRDRVQFIAVHNLKQAGQDSLD